MNKKRNMYAAASLAALMILVISGRPASAEVTFDWATIGNPGNAADPLNEGNVPGIGAVDHVYRIARHEVTNEQYAEFLNAVADADPNGLYHPSMGSDPRGGITQSGSSGSYTYAVRANMGNKPVNFVSFFDAMRFVNWLHNAQPTGAQDASTTEDGVYLISDGLFETRTPGARFFLPTENEWYKAAYHQPSTFGGDADDYWLYPTASNSAPTIATANATGDISNPGVNVANHFLGADWPFYLDGNVTTAGSAGPLSESYYGTSDQAGNVWEWNETLVSVSARGFRGGSWVDPPPVLASTQLAGGVPTSESVVIGFRVGSPVPEVTFDWATVGNPGNAPDPMNEGTIPGIGSVDEVYMIARHEVINDQYCAFLNAVASTMDVHDLYHVNMGLNARGGINQAGSPGAFTYSVKTNMGNKPVNYISFFDAMRFVNWLHNGQPTGVQDVSTTEDGVYTISDGLSETRSANARFFIPTENEWYKAAYHQPATMGGDADDYWLYPTASNDSPLMATASSTGDISNPGANVANHSSGADWNGQNGNVTTVGSAGTGSASYYDTWDQGGNVWEWNETLGSNDRGMRGGGFANSVTALSSLNPASMPPDIASPDFGFRVASPVPEVIFDWAIVGNPKNAPDDTYDGYGSVDHVFRITKHEVTNDQYAAFLNAVGSTADAHALYSTSMATDIRGGISRSGGMAHYTYGAKVNMGNKPVNYVSYFEAMRFVNWLHNGQPTGVQDATTTEDGVYLIGDGVSEVRAADARFFLPTGDEWYKAAYHQPAAEGGDTDDYWDYPTASNTVPTGATADTVGDISNPGENVANYGSSAGWNGASYNVTTVGSAGPLSESFYGTYDQGGNVDEWVDEHLTSCRFDRGGAAGRDAFVMTSYGGGDCRTPTDRLQILGFRVAGPVPEMRFQPIRSAPLGSPVGTVGDPITPQYNADLGCWDVVVHAGVEVTLDLQAFGWSRARGGPQLASIHSAVLSAGYSNGVGADLHPKGWPATPSDGAYLTMSACDGNGDPCDSPPFDATCAAGANGVCSANPDFVLHGTVFADTIVSSIDYFWGALTLSDPSLDDDNVKTLGGLILEVPANAGGTYRIELDPAQTEMQDQNHDVIPGVAVTPACITVDPPEMRFVPVRSAPLGSPVGTIGNPVTPQFNHGLGCWDVVVPAGVEVDLDLQASNWSHAPGAPQLGNIQGAVDPTGYGNGLAADLNPKGWPATPYDGAYLTDVACTVNGNPCGSGTHGPFDSTCDGGANGSCNRNPDWVFFSALFDVPTLYLNSISYEWSAFPFSGSESDDGTVRTLGGLIVEVPADAYGTYAIGFDETNTWMRKPSGVLIPGLVRTPACITIADLEAPVLAPPPHDILKNRYISIDPRGAVGANVGQNFDIRVTLTSTLVNGVAAVGTSWWANPPDANCISIVGPTQPATPPNWDACPTLHLTGCPIIPTSDYDIEVVGGGILTAQTQAKPGVKWWGDCVGNFNGTEWTPPQGVTNIDDAVAAIKTWQGPGGSSATHVSVTDVHPNLSGTQINSVVNFDDVFQLILAFKGNEYPGASVAACMDP